MQTFAVFETQGLLSSPVFKINIKSVKTTGVRKEQVEGSQNIVMEGDYPENENNKVEMGEKTLVATQSEYGLDKQRRQEKLLIAQQGHHEDQKSVSK